MGQDSYFIIQFLREISLHWRLSQLIGFARVCSNAGDFNNRNLFSTVKLLKQGYRYHKIQKTFSKFYHRHSELIVKYNIGLKLFCDKAYQSLYFMVI